LRSAFRDWATKANRILGKDRKAMRRKIEQKEATEKMVKALRRQAESKSATKSVA
jgi:intergrase/recombinase